jgi:5-enolpyruvylshikimate-3-phosphate synthase
MAGEIMNLFSEKNNIRVINKSAVNKSYPTFFEDLEKIKQYLNT